MIMEEVRVKSKMITSEDCPCNTCLCRPLCISRNWFDLVSDCHYLENYLRDITVAAHKERGLAQEECLIINIVGLQKYFTSILSKDFSKTGKVYFGLIGEPTVDALTEHIDELEARQSICKKFNNNIVMRMRFKESSLPKIGMNIVERDGMSFLELRDMMENVLSTSWWELTESRIKS